MSGRISALGVDPNKIILQLVQEVLPDLPVGFDMPVGDRKAWLTLSMGAMVTPISQRATLTVSVYSTTSSGTLDWADADSTWRLIARTLLAHATDYPLIDVQLQTGPMTSHDSDLHVDYVYGALVMDVAAK